MKLGMLVWHHTNNKYHDGSSGMDAYITYNAASGTYSVQTPPVKLIINDTPYPHLQPVQWANYAPHNSPPYVNGISALASYNRAIHILDNHAEVRAAYLDDNDQILMISTSMRSDVASGNPWFGYKGMIPMYPMPNGFATMMGAPGSWIGDRYTRSGTIVMASGYQGRVAAKALVVPRETGCNWTELDFRGNNANGPWPSGPNWVGTGYQLPVGKLWSVDIPKTSFVLSGGYSMASFTLDSDGWYSDRKILRSSVDPREYVLVWFLEVDAFFGGPTSAYFDRATDSSCLFLP